MAERGGTRPRSRALAAVTVLAMPAGAGPRDAERLAETLPRGWCGDYRWRGDTRVQHFAILFQRVEARADGTVEATGKGLITVAEQRYPIDVRAVVDPSAGQVELWESRPVPDTVEFTTDGSHVGRLHDRMHRIDAVWTQNRTGQQGDLRLVARPPTPDLGLLCATPTA